MITIAETKSSCSRSYYESSPEVPEFIAPITSGWCRPLQRAPVVHRKYQHLSTSGTMELRTGTRYTDVMYKVPYVRTRYVHCAGLHNPTPLLNVWGFFVLYPQNNSPPGTPQGCPANTATTIPDQTLPAVSSLLLFTHLLPNPIQTFAVLRAAAVNSQFSSVRQVSTTASSIILQEQKAKQPGPCTASWHTAGARAFVGLVRLLLSINSQLIRSSLPSAVPAGQQ